ncbi:MAG: hypothetical protein U0841_16555 [Chloroflexia bacterium]
MALAQGGGRRSAADRGAAVGLGGGFGPGRAAQPIPLLLKLRGRRYSRSRRRQRHWRARWGALERGVGPTCGRFRGGSLGWAYQRLRRDDDARQAFAAARQLVEELAATLDDTPLREQFRRTALATLPQERPISRREATRRAFGGLTARECEVAALIVQGRQAVRSPRGW